MSVVNQSAMLKLLSRRIFSSQNLLFWADRVLIRVVQIVLPILPFSLERWLKPKSYYQSDSDFIILWFSGLLPWIDNYAHIFGFIFGILLSFALLPYVTFGSEDRRRKLIIKITCIVLVIVLYVVLFIVFYVTPIRECKGCRYINCVPFKSDFCENMGVEVEATETKFEWEGDDLSNLWSWNKNEFMKISQSVVYLLEISHSFLFDFKSTGIPWHFD